MVLSISQNVIHVINLYVDLIVTNEKWPGTRSDRETPRSVLKNCRFIASEDQLLSSKMDCV